MAVVELARVVIREDFVRLLDRLEPFVGLGALFVGHLVRVVGSRCLWSCHAGGQTWLLLPFLLGWSTAGAIYTLWYAFLISILSAPRSISRTSGRLSKEGVVVHLHFRHMEHTVEVDFFRAHCWSSVSRGFCSSLVSFFLFVFLFGFVLF